MPGVDAIVADVCCSCASLLQGAKGSNVHRELNSQARTNDMDYTNDPESNTKSNSMRAQAGGSTSMPSKPKKEPNPDEEHEAQEETRDPNQVNDPNRQAREGDDKNYPGRTIGQL
jgi:hypothetical protein